MKKYLVPTDFSKNAAQALQYALDLTVGMDAEIHVLSVLTTPPNTAGTMGSLLIRMKENAQKDMQSLLDEMKLEGHKIEPYIREGGTVPTVIAVAEEIGAECIILGTKGASNLENVIMGSNTASIIERSKVPVMAIPQGFSFAGLDRVVYATDLQKSGPQIANRLLQFTEPFSSRIDVVHVHDSDSDSPVIQMNLLKKEMQEGAQNRLVKYHLHQHDSIKEGILNFMDASGAELLVMVTKKRNLMQKLFDRSLTKKVAYLTETPLLAYQAEESTN